MRVIFTKGMQASGKSTWAKEYVQANPQFKRVSRDDFRYMLDGYSFSKETEELVTEMESQTIFYLMQKGFNLIIDKMNLSDRYL